MSIGQLLREYRIENSKTQKEWAGDIFSTSYYAKIEKDQHRITVQDLIDLLCVNNIKLVDFFGKLQLKDKLRYDQDIEINEAIADAYYHTDKEKLYKLKHMIEESSIKNKDDYLVRIDLWIAKVDNSLDSLSETVKNNLKETIFNSSNFDRPKLALYCNFMQLYDLDSNLLISRRIIKQTLNNDDLKIQEVLLAIVGNIIGMCIENNRYAEVDEFIKVSKQIPTKPALFFYKNGLLLFENMVKYKLNPDSKYLDKCNLAIKNFEILGMPEYAKELENFFEKNK